MLAPVGGKGSSLCWLKWANFCQLVLLLLAVQNYPEKSQALWLALSVFANISQVSPFRPNAWLHFRVPCTVQTVYHPAASGTLVCVTEGSARGGGAVPVTQIPTAHLTRHWHKAPSCPLSSLERSIAQSRAELAFPAILSRCHPFELQVKQTVLFLTQSTVPI